MPAITRRPAEAVTAALAAVAAAVLTAQPLHAFDLQRFTAVRGPAAARAADPVALAALQAFEGPDLAGEDGPMARAGLDLALLYHEHADYVARGRPGTFTTSVQGARLEGELVLVDAIADLNSSTLLGSLQLLGLTNGAAQDRVASGWLPIASLDAASRAPGLRQLRLVYAIAATGIATSQGDTALHAAAARQAYGVTGAGTTVGAISDSFNCLNGYTTDVATGDLPAGIAVLEEVGGCTSATDEGRAMLQIVHDLAPGANLAFHSGFNGTASFAAGIGDLVSQAGADVIVDDVVELTEPMFQDGPIAQAVDSAVALGAAYYSAAGNAGRQSYEASFSLSSVNGAVGRRHKFSATDTLQSFQLSAGARAFIVLQWDQPFFSVTGGGGATSDLDLVIYDGNGTPLAASGMQNVGGDAVDVLAIQNTSASPVTWQLAIERRNNVSPAHIKYVVFAVAGTFTLLEYSTNSDTVFGHANAAGARAVGAASYAQTPAYGVTPPALESYSSQGGTTILFTSTGTPTNVVRRKPEIVAVDGVDNRFFGVDTDSSGYPNFYGTSAAAPHAAALAALARSLDHSATPATVNSALLESAVDMGTAGYDDDTGAGLVQADRMLAIVAAHASGRVTLGFGATASGVALASPFPADQFASLGVRITDSDTAAGTSLTALPGNGPAAGLSGSFLYVPGSTPSTWVDFELTPPARDIHFDFATPTGQILITGFDSTGAVVLSVAVTGSAPFAGPDGTTWLAGNTALPSTLFMSRVRIAAAVGAAPLAVDNLGFTTSAVAADVPIPLPAIVTAALMLLGTGWRRLDARRR